MNNDIINSLIKVNNSYIIPGYIISNLSKLDLSKDELILMIYLINQKDNIIFNLDKISKDLNMEFPVLFDLINKLNEKNYISIEMKKNNGIIEEYISLELFYAKISSLIVSSSEEKKESNIYTTFEKEFGRTLSPIEYETITNWIDSNISEELIVSALKEAVLNGVNSLRYIDKILFEWNKKGYKKIEDIKNDKYNKDDDHVEEIFDYDWINDD